VYSPKKYHQNTVYELHVAVHETSAHRYRYSKILGEIMERLEWLLVQGRGWRKDSKCIGMQS